MQDHLTTVYLKWMGLGLGLNADLAVQEKEFTPELKASMEQETKLFFKELLAQRRHHQRPADLEQGLRRQGAGHPPGRAGAGGHRLRAGHLPGRPARRRPDPAGRHRAATRWATPRCSAASSCATSSCARRSRRRPNIPEIEEETKAAENLPAREQSKRRLDNAHLRRLPHARWIPSGLSFANYDALGRFQTTDEDGKAIDSTGALTGAGDVDGPLKNAVELGEQAGQERRWSAPASRARCSATRSAA